MLCKVDNREKASSQIIDNIRKSNQTPESSIPKIEDINLDDWELECDKKGDVIGQANLYSNKGDWYSCTVQKVFVHPSHRNKGIANKLVSKIIEKARNRKDNGLPDCQILTADIDRSNVPSRTVFEKAGFKIKDSFCVPGENTKADVLRMSLTGIRNCK